jgi:hypothetical protein
MLNYNVTVKIEREIQEDWFTWMKNEHIPRVLGTGLFLESKILRLIEPEDLDGITYSIQFFCEGKKELQEYREKFAAVLQAEHNERYRGKFVSFRTVLESVS